MFVFRRPGALQSGYGFVEMIDDACRRIPGLDRGCVHKRLEGGSRLTMRLHGAIEMAGVEVASADHGTDVPGARIQRDEGCLKRIALRNRIRCRAARVLAAAFLRRIPPG